MYKKEKALVIKGSASALCNNLSVVLDEDHGTVTYAVVHKSFVVLLTTGLDGGNIFHRQVLYKEPASSFSGQPIVLQAKLLQVEHRCILVAASQKSIQMFEGDGSVLLHWHALNDQGRPEDCESFARGVCSLGTNRICIGNHRGNIMVFDVPVKSPNITLLEEVKAHSHPISDLASYKEKLASSDDQGNIIIWLHSDDKFSKAVSISGSGYPCSSLCLSDNVVIGGYGSGHIRVYNIDTGMIGSEVTAHARWINAVSFNHKSNMLLSVGDDSFVRMWQIKSGQLPQIEHKFNGCVKDQQLVGASFCRTDSTGFSVTGYDSNEITIFSI